MIKFAFPGLPGIKAVYNCKMAIFISCRTVFSALRFLLCLFIFVACNKGDSGLPGIETKQVMDITSGTAVSGGVITEEGGSHIVTAGVCWSSSPSPTINDQYTEDELSDGGFVSQISGLKENTRYYIRSYASNDTGTSYGQEITFVTYYADDQPEVHTGATTSVHSNSVNVHFELVSHGGELVYQAGVYISEDQGNVTAGRNIVADIDGQGEYSVTASGLEPETRYYYVAYAISGAGISYGDQKTFLTTSQGPCEGVVPPAGFGVVEFNGRCWLDRNLGAARTASSAGDAASFGSLYQWGRESDGHESPTSEITSVLSPAGQQPGHGDYIVKYTYPFDWNSNNDWTNRWVLAGGAISAADPCPEGWRVPTINEWQSAIEYGDWQDGGDAFSSPLRLPAAGKRDDKGVLYDQGSRGYYWSSSNQNIFGKALLYYEDGIFTGNYYRVGGMSVRCIRDK